MENQSDKMLTQTIRACLQQLQLSAYPHAELIRICLLADPSECNMGSPGIFLIAPCWLHDYSLRSKCQGLFDNVL